MVFFVLLTDLMHVAQDEFEKIYGYLRKQQLHKGEIHIVHLGTLLLPWKHYFVRNIKE